MYKPALPTQQAFDCQATAALLRSLAPLVWASHVAALGAAYWAAWPALAIWGVVLYFAVRVQLDAGLFELLARDPAQGPGRLDDWLLRAGLRREVSSRSLEERCAGGRRLARNFLLAWALQMFTLGLMAIRRNI